jgi:rod shape-determining protein MreC
MYMVKKNITIGIFIIFFLLFGMYGFLKFAEAGVFHILRPLFIASNAVGGFVGSVTSTLIGIPYNSEEVRALREEVARLRAHQAIAEGWERENMVLREMAGRKTEDELYILAHVIGRSFDSFDDVIVLDIGSADGIESGLPVLAAGAIHIGFIEIVTEHSARVRLLSRIGQKQEVYLPESALLSVANGEGLGVIALQVPDSIAVKKGEAVFSTGRRDYLLGFVEAIERSESGPFQVIRTGLPFSIRDVRDVFVILN